MPDWVIIILQGYGLAGIVIAALAIAVYQQFKNSTEVNNNRLSERDVLIKALESNTTAIRENARATEARNTITQDLASAITKQATAFEMFLQKAEFQQENLKDNVRDQKAVIEAVSESIRIHTGILTDIRNKMATL